MHDHASTVFEDYCRQQHVGAARYGVSNLEFDFVRVERPGHGPERAVVSEVKWKRLSLGERAQTKKRLADAWKRCALHPKYKEVNFEVLDATILKELPSGP